MRAPRVEVYRGKDKKWYWRMRAGNGKIVADGSQGYASKAGGEKAAKKLMEDIQLASADIEVEVLEG